MSLNQNSRGTKVSNKFKPLRSQLCKKHFNAGNTSKANRNESSSIEIPFNLSKKISNSSQLHTYISKISAYNHPIFTFRDAEFTNFEYRYI